MMNSHMAVIRPTMIHGNVSIAQFNLRLTDSKRMRARVATAEPSGRCRTQRTGSNGIRTGVNPVATITVFFMILKLRGLGPVAFNYLTWSNCTRLWPF